MATYSELLKDPRWQKKRLETLQRDNWTCQLCRDTKETLHVHHNEYNKEPWYIDNSLLITYCETCHSVVEFIKKGISAESCVDFATGFLFGYRHGIKLIAFIDHSAYGKRLLIFDKENLWDQIVVYPESIKKILTNFSEL